MDTLRPIARLGRRAPVAFLVAALLLALVWLVFTPASAQARAPSFPDVDQSMPAYDAIGYLSAAGVISGYVDGSFGPADILKRGQATKMLVLWQNVPLVTGKSSFPDVDAVYRDFIETAC
ncbi:MAG: S-layer homology domain-containing protein, partial [Thermoleophilia bacterium]|nr:S-layer homology domain-containing protein [Thermoleophilia bacterium]